MSSLKQKIQNHELRRSYRDIAEDCFFPEDLKYGKEQFDELSSTKEWIRVEWIVGLLDSYVCVERKKLQKLWDERPNFDEAEASKPLESLLVSRAKCIEWFARLKKALET